MRPLSSAEAFRFYVREGEPLSYVAESGLDLIEAVKRVPAGSLEFHVEGGHLAAWLRAVIGDAVAAEMVEGLRGLKGEELRRKLYGILWKRVAEAVSAKAREGALAAR